MLLVIHRGRRKRHDVDGVEQPESGVQVMNTDWMYLIDPEGHTPLTRASKSGRGDVTNLMLMQMIEDSPSNIRRLSPILRAAWAGYYEAIEDLLDEGADPNEIDWQGETPLHKAARLGHLESVCTLLNRGAHVNAQDSFGLTALHWAVLTGNRDVAEALVYNGANVYARDNVTGGLTPVSMARVMGYTEILNLLTSHASIF